MRRNDRSRLTLIGLAFPVVAACAGPRPHAEVDQGPLSDDRRARLVQVVVEELLVSESFALGAPETAALENKNWSCAQRRGFINCATTAAPGLSLFLQYYERQLQGIGVVVEGLSGALSNVCATYRSISNDLGSRLGKEDTRLSGPCELERPILYEPSCASWIQKDTRVTAGVDRSPDDLDRAYLQLRLDPSSREQEFCNPTRPVAK